MRSTEPMQNEPTAAGTATRPPPGPRLSGHVRLRFDRVRERHVLLGPESVLLLNATGAAVLELCDGRRTVAEIVHELGRRYEHVAEAEVRDYLDRMAANRCVEFGDD